VRIARGSHAQADAAAHAYETHAVPAVFAPLAEATLANVVVPPGSWLIDIACGTGILARRIAARMRGAGWIVGIDQDPAKTALARAATPKLAHRIDWITGDATALTYPDGTFELVFCQAGLASLPDKPAALVEMRRVLGARGRLVLTCWNEPNSLARLIADALADRIGAHLARTCLAPFSQSDATATQALIAAAGFDLGPPKVLTLRRRLLADKDMIRAEILASPAGQDLLDAGARVIERVVGDVLDGLRPVAGPHGVDVIQHAHLYIARSRPIPRIAIEIDAG